MGLATLVSFILFVSWGEGFHHGAFWKHFPQANSQLEKASGENEKQE